MWAQPTPSHIPLLSQLTFLQRIHVYYGVFPFSLLGIQTEFPRDHYSPSYSYELRVLVSGESSTIMQYARRGLSDFIKGNNRSRNQTQNSGFYGCY